MMNIYNVGQFKITTWGQFQNAINLMPTNGKDKDEEEYDDHHDS